MTLFPRKYGDPYDDGDGLSSMHAHAWGRITWALSYTFHERLELEHFWLPPLLFAPHDSWRRSFRMASILALVMKAAARSVTPREVEP